MRACSRTLLLVLASLALALPALGQGALWPVRILPPDPHMVPPPVPPRSWPLTCVSQKVDMQVRDFATTVTVEQAFRNQYNSRIEGTFLFPLPEGAAVTDFGMTVNGEPVGAELLDATKARTVYEEIVRRQLDPGLLEYVGRGSFRARIFPIEANETKRIKLEYTYALTPEDGLARLVFPLKTRANQQFQPPPPWPHPWPHPLPMVRAGDADRPDGGRETRPGPGNPGEIGQLTVALRIESKTGIKSVYSPTHDIDVHRDGDHVVKAGFEGAHVQPTDDFIVYIQLSDASFGLNLLPYRGADDETGTFMMLLAPKSELRDTEVAAKDIVFVVDTSGSMAGKKMEQTKSALRYCLRNLKTADRFALLSFSTAVDAFEQGLVPASEDNVKKAVEFVDKLAARGGTNIAEALAGGLDRLAAGADKARPQMVLFMTDGQPTVGEVRIPRILEQAEKSNHGDARLFVFGVGDDVNTELLDRLGDDNHGLCSYVRPTEDIEVAVSSLYGKIASPVLGDLKLTVDGVKVEELQPVRLPDLFRGSQLTLLGRYRGDGDATVTLEGTAPGGPQKHTYHVNFPKRERANNFVPRLWATRRVGYLLDQMRLNGESAELKDEVVRLATRYGILTPYTSYLVLEPGVKAESAATRALQTQLNQHGTGGFGGAGRFGGPGGPDRLAVPAAPPTSAKTGADAVARSQGEGALRRADQNVAGGAVAGGRVAGGAAATQQAGNRTFYLIDQTWVDSTVPADEAKLTVVKVKWGSQAYFDLLTLRDDLKECLAVGQQIKVKLSNTLLVVDEDGATELTAAQRKAIQG